MPETEKKKLLPVFISFHILVSNPVNPIPTIIITGALLLVYYLFHDKIKNHFIDVYNSGIMLAGALTSTVLFTTYYFGIGASGESVIEMIKSYISLGFHPNWRGVLYGTIVLVIMVTFPRKFKSVSKYISAPFIAIIFTLILNLILNPSDMVSAITEIPQFNTEHFKDFTIKNFNPDFNISSVINGIALFFLLISVYTNNCESRKKDLLIYSGVNILSSGLFLLPLPYGINKNKKSFIPRIIAVLITLTFFIIFKDIAERIPLHSCAVVIIVSAWESVKWNEIKLSFSTIKNTILFIISFVVSLLTNISIGIIVSFIISKFFKTFENKKIKPAE